ncbi:MAG: hypothetical protein AAGI49_07955, partial [Bacteroidota bacterium]
EWTSDKNLFLLEAHQDILLEKDFHLLQQHTAEKRADILEDRIRAKRQRFEARIAGVSWLSWNYADWRNRR